MKPEVVRVSEELAGTGLQGQVPGDERRGPRDVGPARGTSGGRFGLSGMERRAIGVSWLAGMAIVSLVIFLDIVSQVFGSGRRGWLDPLIEELSSWATMTLALLVAAAVAVWLRRARRQPWLAVLVLLAGLVLSFVIHVGGFHVLRTLAYPLLAGRPYESDPLFFGILFEGAKELPAYLFAVTANWWILRWFEERQPAAAGEPTWFDIRDGARIVRVPVADILAVRSAGNYVEFLLGDGRSPLMRAALSALEPKLAAHGFVRTHRSWLVNSTRMSGLRPDGSGDYTVELGELEAPLSRRFPKALTTLRG